MTALTARAYCTLPVEQRAAVNDWLTEHGIDPAKVQGLHVREDGTVDTVCTIRRGGSLFMVAGLLATEVCTFTPTRPLPVGE